MAKKIYNVSIEQPMCKTWEVEADTLEEAEEIAIEKYREGEFVIGADDYGTDAQIMVESEERDELEVGAKESTDWHDF